MEAGENSFAFYSNNEFQDVSSSTWKDPKSVPRNAASIKWTVYFPSYFPRVYLTNKSTDVILNPLELQQRRVFTSILTLRECREH